MTASTPEDPLTAAARSGDRLMRALHRIGIQVGVELTELYADVNGIGKPVLVLGKIDADAAGRLADALGEPDLAPEAGS
jgi:hypothetical protein